MLSILDRPSTQRLRPDNPPPPRNRNMQIPRRPRFPERPTAHRGPHAWTALIVECMEDIRFCVLCGGHFRGGLCIDGITLVRGAIVWRFGHLRNMLLRHRYDGVLYEVVVLVPEYSTLNSGIVQMNGRMRTSRGKE
jgi:hypothetical protein